MTHSKDLVSNNSVATSMDYLTVVDVYLAVGPGESVLAHARVARDAVHARGARRTRVRLALVYIYRAVLSCKHNISNNIGNK